MNNKNNNNKINNKNIVVKDKLEKKFMLYCKKNNKNKKLCYFYREIFVNKMIYKCIYPEFIEKGLKKFIS